MKVNRLMIVGFCLVIVAVVLGYVYLTQFGINPENIGIFNNCNEASDCVITQTRYCGELVAINAQFEEMWNEKVIKPTLVKMRCSDEFYENLEKHTAACDNGKCVVLEIEYIGL